MNLFYIFLLLICHRVSSSPAFLSGDNGESGLEKLGIFKGNNYFQASEQVFYLCNHTASNEEQQNRTIPDGYTITPGIGAHKLYLTNQDWNQARNTCTQEGAHLAIITSVEEEDIIRKLQQQANVFAAWLGVHEQFKKDDWVTVLDQSFSSIGYAHWRDGEPNNFQNLGEHCVSYENPMNDLNCNMTIPFICKISLK